MRPFINIINSWSLNGLINLSANLRIIISFIWLNIPIIIIIIINIFWCIYTSSFIRSRSFLLFIICSTRISSCIRSCLIFICFSGVIYRSLSSIYFDVILRSWNNSIWRINIWIIFYIWPRYYFSFRSDIRIFIRNVILVSTRLSIIISISIIRSFIFRSLSGTNIKIFIIFSWVNSFGGSRRNILGLLFNIIEIFIRISILLIRIIQIFSFIINIDIPIIYSLTSINILVIIYICFWSSSIYISIIYSLTPIYILYILSVIYICI